ncbi:hypothetical protein CC86DRAFT_181430 [Ophiobolus disseminans]|uniref:Uncharacterized protein n=1 Tax=Ophiobolus disseminans TaxID=1469910 RepID=A0A6A7AAE0_9PLEO|nr:hypothetical protein CC86DRAFT_181430 [Ophiobolus disseminans]
MPYIYARQNPLDDARNTLSSWDNCMAKSYCKWPVIVAIIIGSLIVLSVVVCIARCICCGAECAMCCCKCCTCCCGSSGDRGHKRMKSDPTPTYPPYAAAGTPNPYAPNPYAQAHAAAPPPPIDTRPVDQQYRSHATPAFAPAAAPSNERPQFATFASPAKPVNEDALPAMPSWGDARDRHIEVEEPPPPQKRGDMELDRLNHNGSVNSGSMAAMGAIGARRLPAPTRSPISPMGDGYGYAQGFENEPLVGAPRTPHDGPGICGRLYPQQDEYRRGSPAHNLSPVYGAGEGYAQNQSYDRHSPVQPQPYSQYDHRDQYDHAESYSQSLPPYRSPSPPTQTPYNYNTNNNASYDNFAPAPAPVQQRSHTPGYSQPAPAAYEPIEPPAEPVSAYPGQRSYTPQSAYPGQTTYQAFNPGQTSQQFTGVQRKGVDGSYRDI